MSVPVALRRIRPTLVLSYLLIFLIGYGAALFVRGTTDLPDETPGREYRSQGVLTSPLLECDADSIQSRVLFGRFWDEIKPIIEREKARPGVSDVSVYFRDMSNGPWYGYNALADFSPASLLKVPLMIAYLRWAEDEPDILRKEFEFHADAEAYLQNVVPEESMEPGKKYSVDELIARMIGYSDNNAAIILLDKLDKGRLSQTYEALGVVPPLPGKVEDFMSVKAYASFFRILFNASYLHQDMSERALEYLAKSGFRVGLVAGVPAGTIVAHKFGERTIEASDQRQLHDCGIVYYPKRPYLLCVMTRGRDNNILATTIQNISAAVYAGVERRVTAANEQ